MRRLFTTLILVLGIFWAQIAAASSVATIGFSSNGGTTITNPLTPNVASGGSPSYDIFVTILTAGQIVAAYDLNVLYSTTYLRPKISTAVSYDDSSPYIFGNPASFEVIRSSNTATFGMINLKMVSLLSDEALQSRQNASVGTKIKLATLNFDAVATGTANLSFDWSAPTVTMRDVKGLNNQIIVSADAVPEPSTYIMSLVAGLIVGGAVWLRRRQAAAA